jgi:hypothetical protein
MEDPFRGARGTTPFSVVTVAASASISNRSRSARRRERSHLALARRRSRGFGGFLVLAHDRASWEATLRSYELLARFVVPHFTGVLDPARGSYEMCASKKREYGGPAMAAIAKAYEDAGKELPADLTAANLR